MCCDERRAIVTPRVAAQQSGAPAVGSEQAEQHADRGRLARAVGAKEPEHLALAHVERDVVHGSCGAVDLGEVLNLNHQLWHLILIELFSRSRL